MSEMATKILEESLGKIVLVRLRGGKKLRGKLKGFDQHLNLVLEETDDTTDISNVKSLGAIIVRGDNVVIISPPPRWFYWEKLVKGPHLLENVPTKHFTSNVEDAEKDLITSMKKDAQPAAMDRLKK